MRIRVMLGSMLSGLVLSGAASAADFVTGTYDTEDDGRGALQLSPGLEFRATDGLELAFTPRNGPATTLRLSIDRPDAEDGSRGLLDVVGGLSQLGVRSVATGSDRPSAGFDDPVGVTGTVLTGGLFLGGAVARDGAVEALGAGVGYGPVRTWLTYGTVEQDERRAGSEMLMLSTDLVASSWFSVEGDLAVTAREDERETDTAGRIGFRLKF